MLAALTRSVVVHSVSAWECYVERLAVEAVDAMRPPGAALGPWPVHFAIVKGQAAALHTPDPDKVRALFSNALGLADIHLAWAWAGVVQVQAVQALWKAMNLRHTIAHGANPRPAVAHHYSSALPDFFRRLGHATDQAVRSHLVNTLGVLNPWP